MNNFLSMTSGVVVRKGLRNNNVAEYVRNNHTRLPRRERHRVYTHFGDVPSLSPFPVLVAAFHIKINLTGSAIVILS